MNFFFFLKQKTIRQTKKKSVTLSHDFDIGAEITHAPSLIQKAENACKLMRVEISQYKKFF